MRKKWKRVLSLIISASLVLGMTPMSSFAKTPDEPEVVTEETTTEAVTEEATTEVVTEEATTEAATEEASTEAVTEEPTTEGARKKKPAVVSLGDPSGDSFPVISLNTSIEISLDAGEYWIGSFTAPADGTYIFYSVSNDDTEAYLYSDEELTEEKAHGDDEGGDSQFKIVYNMFSGATIYLKVSSFQAKYSVDGAVVVTDDKDLALGTVVLNKERYLLDDHNTTVDAVVTSAGDTELTEGTDFEFVYLDSDDNVISGFPTTAGDYKVYAKAIGNTYYGQTEAEQFRLNDESDLSYAAFYIDPDSYDLATDPTDVAATVESYNGDTLTKGTDYELVYLDGDDVLGGFPAKTGSYRVYAKGIGSYTGETTSEPFYVFDSRDLSAVSVSIDKSRFEYTGQPIQMNVSVKVNSVELTEGTDYKLYYCKNVDYYRSDRHESENIPSEPGEYNVYAKGLTPYYGETDFNSFVIYDPYDIGSMYTYYSGPYEFNIPEDTVEISGVQIYYSNESYATQYLEEETDFAFDHYEDENEKVLSGTPTDPGAYYAVFKGITPYKGEQKFFFRLVGDYTDLTKATITMNPSIYNYTGEEVYLSFNVKDVNGSYVYNSYYETVYYSEKGEVLPGAPSEVGTYKLAVKAKADTEYKGESDPVVFYIVGENDLRNSNVWSISAKTYYIPKNGSPVTPPSVRIYRYVSGEGYLYLEEGTDYKFSHFENDKGEDIGSNAVELGKYTAYYEGSGDYSGEIGAEFEIVSPLNLEYATFTIDEYVPMIDGVVSPKTTVVDLAGTTLKEGQDYELVYEKNGTVISSITSTGGYYAYAKAIDGSDYTGTTSDKWFVVYDPYNFLDENVVWYAYFTADDWIPLTAGKLPKPEIFRDDNNEKTVLTEGTDYQLKSLISIVDSVETEIDGTFPVERGKYRAVYEGIGKYKGEISISFSIYDPYYLEETDKYGYSQLWSAYFSDDCWVTTGAEVLPDVWIYRNDPDDDDGQIYLAKDDYKLVRIENEAYQDLGSTAVPKTPGDFYAVYEGQKPYSGIKKVKFQVFDTSDIGSDYWYIISDPSTIYTDGGVVAVPKALIYNEENQVSLTEGKDFTLDSIKTIAGEEVNVNELSANGWYTATYKGIGDYTGTTSISFYIRNSYNLENAKLNLEDYSILATGSPVALTSWVRDQAGIELDPDKDYALVYFDGDGKELSEIPSEPGSYYVKAQAKAGSAYEGETPRVSFKIVKETVIEPPETLELNTDYSVNADEGKDWIGVFTATSDGTYVFESTKYTKGDPYGYLYKDADLTYLITSNDDDGEGYNFRMTRSMKQGDRVYLVAKSGYNGNVLEATVHVTKLDEKDLANATILIDYEKSTVQGNVRIPVIEVYDANGNLLTEKTDYICEVEMYEGDDYQEITEITKGGTYIVMATAVTGSSYKNSTAWTYFTVDDIWSLSDADISCKSRINKGEDAIKTIAVKDSQEKVLTYGTDYDLVFYKSMEKGYVRTLGAPTEPGSYMVYAKAVGGKYTGKTDSAYFKIVDPYDLTDGAYITFANACYDENVGYGEIPVFLRSGSEVKPKVMVFVKTGEYEWSSLDPEFYEVKYANNNAEGIATVTVTGLEPYTGSIEAQFRIVDKMDLANAVENAGISVTSGGVTERISYSSYVGNADSMVQFPLNSWTGSCQVTVNTSEGRAAIVQGTDFTLSYADEKGKALTAAPTTEGKYQLVLTATETGNYTGEQRTRFSLVDTYDLADVLEVSVSGTKYQPEIRKSGNEVKVQFDEPQNRVGEFTFKLSHGNKALVQGEDYTMTKLADGSWEVTGKGRYKGKVNLKAFYPADTTEAFDMKEAFVTTGSVDDILDGSGSSSSSSDLYNVVAVDADGNILTPNAYMSNLTYGQDFKVGGFVDSNEKTITTAKGGDMVYVMLQGKGAYDGCSRLIKARVIETSVIVESESIEKANVTLGETTYTYDGKVKNPGVKSVVLNGKTLVEGTDYTVTVPAGRKNAETYTYTVTGMGAYKGTVKKSFTINRAASSITIKVQTKTFTERALKYSGQVTKKGSSGKVTYTYYSDAKGTKTVKPANVKNAKVYYVKATLAADTNYKAASSNLVKFTISKAKNTLKIKKANKTLKAADLKKGSKKVQCITATKKKGKLAFKLTSAVKGKKSFKAKFAVNKNTGKITVKKGTAKGTYTIKVKVTAKGNANYKAMTTSVAVTIKVK